MSNYIDPLSPVQVSTLIATDIQSSALHGLPAREELAQVISEVQLQTQTLGASLLHIRIIDPGWAIQRTGWLNVSDDGLLDEIEVEFPNNSGMWWRLTMVEGGNDLTQPNLTLTFQDRIVAYLQDKWGPLGVSPNTKTRAQFIKRLVDAVGHGDGLQPINFVCPEVNQVQLVATTSLRLDGTTTVNATVTSQSSQAKVNKLPGITNSGLLTTNQLTFTLHLASQTGLDPAVVAAWCLAEESSTAAVNRQASGYQNWLNIGPGSSIPAFSSSPAAAANYTAQFLKGQAGGASQSILAIISSANGSPMAQVAAIYQSNWDGNSHYNNGANLIATYQEITGAPPSGTVSGLPSLQAPSDVSQLTRGTADNPDENSWDCMQRLAQEVNWYLFSNGNYLYYMDGLQFGVQNPAVYLKLDSSGTTWTAINPTDGDTATDIVSNLTFTFDNCVAIDTPVSTPWGWKTMGTLEAGDEVFGADGVPTRVVGVSPVYEDRACYVVRFADGVEVVTDGGHYWETAAHRLDGAVNGRRVGTRFVGLRSTEFIADTLKQNHRVMYNAPLVLHGRELPVDPYILGYWLGDGQSATPRITCSYADTTNLVAQLRRAGYGCEPKVYVPSTNNWAKELTCGVPFYVGERRGYRHSDTMTRRLRNLGVLGNKHIPPQYLRASYDQRLALLQGLMDSDGTISRDCEFSQRDRKLMDEVAELIRSLGFAVMPKESKQRATGYPIHGVRFATRAGINVFRLPRKAERYDRSVANKQYEYGNARTIIAVDPVPSVPVRCIRVENEGGLFLVGREMVPTHNTAFAYQETHTRKGKIQRKTGVRTPQTPSQIKMNMICGVLDYRAGDVFVFQDSGVINGRWIVEDATRNCIADRHTQFTLGPPILPNLEPAATSGGAAVSGQAPKTSASQPGTSGNARTPSTGTSGAPGVWYPPAKRVYAAKLDHGPRSSTSGVVIHVNAGGSFAGVVAGFAAGGFTAGVGAHFEVGSQADGPVVEFLPLDRVAWHAGNANGYSVGIEHAGSGASRQEWISGHGNMLQTSATLTAWILQQCELGPPVINTNSPTPVRSDGSPAGNIWPHNLGTLIPGDPNSWGGHICPDGPDGVDYFPWDVWGLMVARAYSGLNSGVQTTSPTGAGGATGSTAKPTGSGTVGATVQIPSLWNS